MTRADSMYGSARTAITDARTTRANAGAYTMPIASIALLRLGPSRPAMTIGPTVIGGTK